MHCVEICARELRRIYSQEPTSSKTSFSFEKGKEREKDYSETKIVDLRKDKRDLVRVSFSSASAAFSRTP